MKDNKLLQLSQEFAVDVIEISYVLKEKKELAIKTIGFF